ncbi:hypothetical protein NLJ89_g4087 [Agrocybe chaxingu]|uniref:Autophagy-related protein 27 n=1 Tax=Agrocybe chaxingu TaxID=84603 RepID=A0A9W8MWU9_9AGAR|nr:hypothetical protein NLJ89_g4087 [Agrocybe chaxingu]
MTVTPTLCDTIVRSLHVDAMLLDPARGRLLATLLSLFLFTTSAFADEKPCTIHDGGKYYDLNPLRSNKDYDIKTPSEQTISLNICQSVKTELFGLKNDIDAGDVGGFIRRGHGDFAIGKTNTTLSIYDGRPRIMMSNGSRCKPKAGEPPGEVRASTAVEFICDKSVFGPGVPRLLVQLPPGDDDIACGFVIEWRTHYACATSEGGGVWGIFATLAVIFLVLLMTYTVLGTLYNRFVLDLRGFDQIPQFSIESMKYHGREAFEWCKDMAGIIILNLGSRNGGGGAYSGLPSANLGQPTLSAIIRKRLARMATIVWRKAGVSGTEVASPTLADLPAHNLVEIGQLHSNEQKPTPSHTNLKSSLLNHYPSQGRKFGPEAQGSTKEERGFMLGDDDADAEELGEVKAPPPPERLVSATPSPPTSTSTTNSGGVAQESSAAARGRDLGGGETIRL